MVDEAVDVSSRRLWVKISVLKEILPEIGDLSDRVLREFSGPHIRVMYSAKSDATLAGLPQIADVEPAAFRQPI